MVLRYDSFAEQVQSRMVAIGWVITDYTRYDTTSVAGLTPSGKAFVATLDGNTVTVTIAGNTRTITRAKELWEQGDKTVDALLAAHELLPPGQR